MAETNKDKFLGHRFELFDEFYDEDNASVRYTAIKEDFSRNVSEWYFFKNGKIEEEISEARKLLKPK